MEKPVIRKAVPEDMEVLLRFEQALINTERAFDPTLRREQTSYYDLRQMMAAPEIALVVAELNDGIAGCGYARIESAKPYLRHARHAYLGFMYVLPEYRGRGIIRMVIQYLKNWSVAQGVDELRLEVYFANTTAIRAYEKAGFKGHMLGMRMAAGPQ